MNKLRGHFLFTLPYQIRLTQLSVQLELNGQVLSSLRYSKQQFPHYKWSLSHAKPLTFRMETLVPTMHRGKQKRYHGFPFFSFFFFYSLFFLVRSGFRRLSRVCSRSLPSPLFCLYISTLHLTKSLSLSRQK